MDKIKYHIQKRERRKKYAYIIKKVSVITLIAVLVFALGYAFGMYLLYKAGV